MRPISRDHRPARALRSPLRPSRSLGCPKALVALIHILIAEEDGSGRAVVRCPRSSLQPKDCSAQGTNKAAPPDRPGEAARRGLGQQGG